ncbi:MAG: glycosyltransferase family 87 protein [Candidatus Aminicenantales bacterium]
MNRKKIAFCVLGILLIAAAFYGVYLGWVKHDMSDFGVCIKNGKRIVDGETLYPGEEIDKHLQFKYAPVSALFYAPLSRLPVETAKIIWYYLELILLFAVFWISYRLLPSRGAGPWFVMGLSLLVFLKYIGREIELGQVNILIIFLLITMLALSMKEKDLWAGGLWGISLIFKPYALVFLPYFILRKRFKLVASGLAVLFAGMLLPALFYGFAGNLTVLKEWALTLSKSTPGLMIVVDNASFYSFLTKALPGHPENVAKVLWLAFGLCAAVLFLWMMGQAKKRSIKKPEILEAAFLMILIPIFSPLGWFYNYLYGVLAVVLLMNFLPKLPPSWKTVLIVDFIMIGASLREILGKTLFRFYNYNSLMAINFLVILGALAYVRAKRIA